MDIRNVVEAARNKFGEVIKVVKTGEGEYFVACKRAVSPFKEAPYMTITAFTHYQPSGAAMENVQFCWGHYDLSVEQVHSRRLEAELKALAA